METKRIHRIIICCDGTGNNSKEFQDHDADILDSSHYDGNDEDIDTAFQISLQAAVMTRTQEDVQLLAECAFSEGIEIGNDLMTRYLTRAEETANEGEIEVLTGAIKMHLASDNMVPAVLSDDDREVNMPSPIKPEDKLISKRRLRVDEMEDEVSKIKQLNRTNVRRMYECIPSGRDTSKIYIPGPGTMPQDNILGNMDSSNLVAQGLGFGIERRIRKVYQYICSVYDSSAHNSIVIIGFSRGTLVAHGIASLISSVGIAEQHSDVLAEQHSDVLFGYWAGNDNPKKYSHYQRKFEARFPDVPLHRDVHIQALGLFDSVWKSWEIRSWNWVFANLPSLNTFPAAKVDKAFHAMSLNEQRYNFPLQRLNSAHPGIKECWFIGHHSDVGGSKQSGPPNLSFLWMIHQLQGLQPAVPFDMELVRSNIQEGVLYRRVLHVSVPWQWIYAIPTARTIRLLFTRRQPRDGDLVHWSAVSLMDCVQTDLPDSPEQRVDLQFQYAKEAASDFELLELGRVDQMSGETFTLAKRVTAVWTNKLFNPLRVFTRNVAVLDHRAALLNFPSVAR